MNSHQAALVLLLLINPFIFSEMSFAAGGKTTSLDIKTVNSAVEQLEKRIAEGDKNLPSLKVEYDYPDATEGVPPSFKFYFEKKKEGNKERSILRVCKTHIGLEVYSKEYIYYFDESGRIMKYLETNSGVRGEPSIPASRNAAIYDKSGQIVWKSGEIIPRIKPKEVIGLFDSLNKNLEKF